MSDTRFNSDDIKKSAANLGEIMSDMSAFTDLEQQDPNCGTFTTAQWLKRLVKDRQEAIVEHAHRLNIVLDDLKTGLTSIADNFSDVTAQNAQQVNAQLQGIETTIAGDVSRFDRDRGDPSTVVAPDAERSEADTATTFTGASPGYPPLSPSGLPQAGYGYPATASGYPGTSYGYPAAAAQQPLYGFPASATSAPPLTAPYGRIGTTMQPTEGFPDARRVEGQEPLAPLQPMLRGQPVEYAEASPRLRDAGEPLQPTLPAHHDVLPEARTVARTQAEIAPTEARLVDRVEPLQPEVAATRARHVEAPVAPLQPEVAATEPRRVEVDRPATAD